MSAKSLIFWAAAGIIALSAVVTLAPGEVPIASLEAGLGPDVKTEAL